MIEKSINIMMILIVILVCIYVVLAFKVIDERRNAECKDFKNISLQNLPVRCVNPQLINK